MCVVVRGIANIKQKANVRSISILRFEYYVVHLIESSRSIRISIPVLQAIDALLKRPNGSC